MITAIEDVVAGMALLPLHLSTYTDCVHAPCHFLWAYVCGWYCGSGTAVLQL
jgi:hypothetical protein